MRTALITGITGQDPYFPAEVGHRCSSLLHLGTICMELRRKLKWDPDKEVFPTTPKPIASSPAPCASRGRCEA